MSLFRSHYGSMNRRPGDFQVCKSHEDCCSCKELARACVEAQYDALTGLVAAEMWTGGEHVPFAIDHGEHSAVAIMVTDHPNGVRSYDLVTEAYVGRVVGMTTRVERVMSDVYDYVTYAVCAEADGSFREHQVSDPDGFRSAVDADADLIARWHAWEKAEEDRKARERDAAYARQIKEREEAEARTPRKGRTVRVVKGRKVPIGTVGRCIWRGESAYGPRVGIKVEGVAEPYWTAASNVEVVVEV